MCVIEFRAQISYIFKIDCYRKSGLSIRKVFITFATKNKSKMILYEKSMKNIK